MEKILIIGMGGHAKSVIDVLEKEKEFEIIGYVVNDMKGKEPKDNKYPVIGNDADLKNLYESGIKNAAMGIGFLGKSNIRKKLWYKLKRIGFRFPVICDSTVVLANDIEMDEGCFLGKGVIVNAGTVIERMSIINTGAIIEHECHIGAFTHISVGSVLCGNVIVEEQSFIGANATIIQGIYIGKECIIGAGVTVRKDLEDNSMMKLKKEINEILTGGGYKVMYAGGISA